MFEPGTHYVNILLLLLYKHMQMCELKLDQFLKFLFALYLETLTSQKMKDFLQTDHQQNHSVNMKIY